MSVDPTIDRRKLRVLLVDDAVAVRRLLTTIIEADLEVAGVANDGAVGLEKIELVRPDVVVLDVAMPGMDGLELLRELQRRNRRVPIIMFSTLTERGAKTTLEALSLGAADYVTKPTKISNPMDALELVRAELVPRIRALARGGKQASAPQRRDSDRPHAAGTSFPPNRRIDLVAIAASTGGPSALTEVLSTISSTIAVPIVITQHMPAVYTAYLAQRLDQVSKIEVREAAEGDILEPGVALVAPGDFHLLISREPAPTVTLDQGPPVNFCRPAADVMFQSVLATYGGDVLAVVLTGMGVDGRQGCMGLKQRGAKTIAQDRQSSVVWGMPGAVVEAGLADLVLPANEIGPAINRLVSSSPGGAARLPR
jgi:two-component system, chemotaxis family, protein-glutamate methylesterase/glutaminase